MKMNFTVQFFYVEPDQMRAPGWYYTNVVTNFTVGPFSTLECAAVNFGRKAA
jgi:hypothetical protein